MTEMRYILDPADEAEGRRLEAHGVLWDAFSTRRMTELGLTDGWRCLEVGGGAGTVARWMAEQVAPTGHVVATDVETRWLDRVATPRLDVVEHDIVSDDLGEAIYDLIHVRLVLMHLPEASDVLAKLVTALRPGGWLVVEDYDCSTGPISHPPTPAWAAVARGPGHLIDQRGGDGNFGRRLPSELRDAGLVDVDTEGLVKPARPSEIRSSWLSLIEQLREPTLELGLATSAEHDEVIEAFHDDDRELVVYGPLLVSARGRKP